jgi:hypothetical protein
MRPEEQSQRFVDQVLNACILTIGLYIATVPVVSQETERSIDAKPLQSTTSSGQKLADRSVPPTTYQGAYNRTCIQVIVQALNALIFRQNSL